MISAGCILWTRTTSNIIKNQSNSRHRVTTSSGRERADLQIAHETIQNRMMRLFQATSGHLHQAIGVYAIYRLHPRNSRETRRHASDKVHQRVGRTSRLVRAAGGGLWISAHGYQDKHQTSHSGGVFAHGFIMHWEWAVWRMHGQPWQVSYAR